MLRESRSSSITSLRPSGAWRAGPWSTRSGCPGRLEIFGKHTDYGGGHTLIAPVPRGFALVARPRSDAVVSLHDASRRQDFVVDTRHGEDLPTSRQRLADQRPDPTTSGPNGWRRYALTVVRRLARNFPGAALGADIVFGSDLAPASGMSSSSALMVALAATLVRLARIDERPEWQANVASAADAAGYYACHRERHGIRLARGRRRRRHARRQRRSHGHRLRQSRPRGGMDVRAAGSPRRRACARGLALRDCVERRGREKDRRGARTLTTISRSGYGRCSIPGTRTRRQRHRCGPR